MSTDDAGSWAQPNPTDRTDPDFVDITRLAPATDGGDASDDTSDITPDIDSATEEDVIEIADAEHAELTVTHVIPHLHQTATEHSPLEALGFEESTILTADIFSEILSALFASSTVTLTVGCPHNLGTVEHFLLGYLGFLQSKQQHIGKELLSKCVPKASLRLVSNRLNILGKKLTSHNFKISVWPEHLDMLSRATGTTNEKIHNIIIH